MSTNPNYSSIPKFRGWPTHTHHLITAAALHYRFRFRSSVQSISHLGVVLPWKDIRHERTLQFDGLNCFQWAFNALSDSLMGLFYNGDESRKNATEFGNSWSKTSRRNLFHGRQWTDILIATNVLVYVAQYVSNGELLDWGAKINSLISEGQLWRLVTSSVLHANIGHLLVNCYSLNSVGPAVENLCGPKRYLAIYITSAITSSAMSYWLCKAPAVGASGAIFGLVGSFAMFFLRHRGIFKGTEGNLKHIAQVIALNMTIGLLFQGIDNWGHLGGLLGGAGMSWLVGPAWEIKTSSRDGRKTFMDNAPIYSLFRRYPR